MLDLLIGRSWLSTCQSKRLFCSCNGATSSVFPKSMHTQWSREIISKQLSSTPLTYRLPIAAGTAPIVSPFPPPYHGTLVLRLHNSNLRHHYHPTLHQALSPVNSDPRPVALSLLEKCIPPERGLGFPTEGRSSEEMKEYCNTILAT